MLSRAYVFGTNHGRERLIALVASRAEWCRLTGYSDSEAKRYGAETGNPAEIAVANSRPGVLFRQPNDYSAGDLWTASDGKRVTVRYGFGDGGHRYDDGYRSLGRCKWAGSGYCDGTRTDPAHTARAVEAP